MERTAEILLRAKPVEGLGESQYVREAIQLAVLELVGRDKELLEALTFQGGTALRLCYGLRRLSEDLDFVAGEGFSRAGEGLADLVKRELPEMESKEKQTDYLYVLDLKYKGVRVKVEIAKVPAYTSSFKKVKSDLFEGPPSTWVKVESLEEVLADKVVAMGLRAFSEGRPFKARDIWDIHWLIEKGIKAEPSMVLRKVKDYGKSTEDFISGLRRRIDFMKREEAVRPFVDEMERFLYGEELEGFSVHPDIAKAVIEEVSDYLRNFLRAVKPNPGVRRIRRRGR